jgi:small subunit ribosomal protein S29
MALQKYWRCLSTLRATPNRLVTPVYNTNATAAFSTTATLEKAGVASKKGSGAAAAQKGRKTLRLGGSKKKGEAPRKAPTPGERKALRKRIVLSNTNAFEVPGIKDWSSETIASESSFGSIVGLPGPVIDQLRAIEAFKATQGWGFFARPTTLVRAETLDLARHIQKPDNKTLRRLVVGARGTGKSILALQAQTMAFLKGWIVVHVPEGMEYA